MYNLQFIQCISILITYYTIIVQYTSTHVTKMAFHVTINGYKPYYGCNHIYDLLIEWLQTKVRL